MRQPSPRTYFVISGAIAVALASEDLVRLVTAGRVPLQGLRQAAFAAAAVFAAVGMSSWQTRKTLELARRLERARAPSAVEANVVAFPHRVSAAQP